MNRLTQRAASHLAPPASEEATIQLCAFVVRKEEFVIDIMRVEEILQPQRVTPVPRAPPFVEGVVNLRGAIIPVVDLRKLLGREEAPEGDAERGRGLKPKLLVCLLGRRRVGLLVDGVSQVLRVTRDSLKPAPALATPGARPHVVGACGPPDRLRLLLDVKALLAAHQASGGSS